MYPYKGGVVRRGGWQSQLRQLGILKLSRKKIYILSGLVFFYTFVAGRSGFYAQVRLWKQGRDLSDNILLEQQKRKWLKEQVESLSNDRQRIALEGRKVAGLGQKDEIIIQIQP
jgi:cell division protein FtsB